MFSFVNLINERRVLLMSLILGLALEGVASDSRFIRSVGLNSSLDFDQIDQNHISFLAERRKGQSIDTVFTDLRVFAERQIFGGSSSSLSSLHKSDFLLFKSVFKVDQSLTVFEDSRFYQAPIQRELFNSIQFKNCSAYQCLAEQSIHSLGISLDVSYQNYYRFLRINNAESLRALGLSSLLVQNSNEFPKYVLIQAGKNWTNCFEDTVSVTFFEQHPKNDGLTLVHSYQVLSLSFFGAIPQTVSLIQAQIQGQIIGFINQINKLRGK